MVARRLSAVILSPDWVPFICFEADGTMYSDQWPVTLPNVPAVTPSMGDIDQDGSPDIVVNSTREIYAFDLQGNVKSGWPFGNSLTKFSFQSPILADLEGDWFAWRLSPKGTEIYHST